MSGEAFAEEISQIRPTCLIVLDSHAKRIAEHKEYSALCRFLWSDPLLSAIWWIRSQPFLEVVIILTNVARWKFNIIPQFEHWCGTPYRLSLREGMISLTRREYDLLLATLMGSKGWWHALSSCWKVSGSTRVRVRLILWTSISVSPLRKIDLQSKKAILRYSWDWLCHTRHALE